MGQFDFLNQPPQTPQQQPPPSQPQPQYQQPQYQPPPQHIAPTPVVVHIGRSKESQALPALANIFLPGLGQLIQGRVIAAIAFHIAMWLNIVLMFALIGFITFPLCYIWCIVDAAKYRE
jgi:TM2 domain-containing membrane protein YozV